MTDVAAPHPGGSGASVDAGVAPTPTQAGPGMAAPTGAVVGMAAPTGAVVGGPGAGSVGAALRALPLQALHDVELNVEVVLGRARMPLRELLAAHPGTTIELDRSVHSTVDVMVNGTLFARGEMVVVDDSEIGVQVTEVIGVDMGRDGRS
ncbi:MAG: FliM/FliN family flagellar motor switch protein [Acidimicrobiales bacterium]